MTIEKIRLQETYAGQTNWQKWGPYLSERQWGTVREDYSANGDAWNYLTHDKARSQAYRWGEDGLGGFCDDQQLFCISLALWNGKDPILKERLFGLTNNEGNHGEDVKELYYFIDATPAHTYQKMLYKYPLNAYPYEWLITENRKRSKQDGEFELIDTGIFDTNEYLDVYIEYAKASPEDVLMQVTVCNRSTNPAPIHVLPQFCFRNIWAWEGQPEERPRISLEQPNTLRIHSLQLGDYWCYTEGNPQFLFTENETNNERLYHTANAYPFVKDAFHERVIHNHTEAINPANEGTKAAAWYTEEIPAQSQIQIKLRLSKEPVDQPFAEFDSILSSRIKEADEFYADLQTGNAEVRLIQRQAWAGLLWSKQYYQYNVNRWLTGDPGLPPPPVGRKYIRNEKWRHFIAGDIISMPDTWEYPWFAAWDLAFHCMAFAAIDPDFAKKQLKLLLLDTYMHPNGQLPAYEWNFSDVNPPVHALAVWWVFKHDYKQKGKPDYVFLESVFLKLALNFNWWVNQKDAEENNIFEGGFLGLDNIGVFDRSSPIPGGGLLEQADGTSWVAMYSLNLMRIAMELALHNPVYEEMAIKYADHFLYISGAIFSDGEDSLGLWDEEDGFYYDLLRKPDGSWDRLRLHTIAGLIPLVSSIVFDETRWQNLPKLIQHLDWFMGQRPDLAKLVSRWKDTNGGYQHLFSLLRGHRMKLLLARMLDEEEFLSEYGIRSISKAYEKNPFVYGLDGQDYSVRYTPAESDSDLFGGNSNWRGPIWIPINYLLIHALYRFHKYYSDDFKVEYPTHSNQYFSLKEIAESLSGRLKKLFLKDEKGERPIFGGHPKFNHDEYFKDYVLFSEYFHGDNGRGLGASHQTGWTALIASLMNE